VADFTRESLAARLALIAAIRAAIDAEGAGPAGK